MHEVGSAPYYQKKHIGNVKYEEVTLQIGLPSKGVYDWLTGTLGGEHTRKTFWISTLDAQFLEIGRRQFNNALITEVGLPALDASSKDAAYMTIKLAPESIEKRPASGKAVTLDASKQKSWLSSNFRLELFFKLALEKLEANAETISRIEAEMYVETMRFVLPAA